MDMDGRYKNNIPKPFTSTYEAEPEHVCNNQSYSRCGPTIRVNALNRLRDSLETYAAYLMTLPWCDKWICCWKLKQVWHPLTFFILSYLNGDVLYAHNTLLLILNFFAIVLNLLIPTKTILTTTYHHHSSFTVSQGGGTKNQSQPP